MIGAISGWNSYYSMYLTRGALFNQAQGAHNAQELQNTQNAQRSGGVWTARRAASPETPVQPVAPVTPVSADKTEPTGLGLPAVREGADPAEMAVRMRIQPYEEQAPLGQTAQPGEAKEAMGAQGVQEAFEEGKCETCEKRKYQDGSDDMGVSFQTPTRIAPEQVASAVRGHEQEHVVREQAKAQRENRRVVSQSVTLHTDICPECGKVYISGGTTRTVTAAEQSQEIEQEAQQETENKGFSVFG